MRTAAAKDCPLFSGMNDEEFSQALHFLRAEQVTYKKRDILWGVCSVVPYFALVLRGTVNVCCDEADGGCTLMAVVTPGRTFGESLAYLEKKASVYPVAATDCVLLQLHPGCLREHIDAPVVRKLQNNFAVMMAQRALEMNDRIQILSKTTLRAKIGALFRHYGGRPDDTVFFLPFDRAGMAFFLGTDRSALSRELGRMKKDGVIDYEKNRFRWKREIRDGRGGA